VSILRQAWRSIRMRRGYSALVAAAIAAGIAANAIAFAIVDAAVLRPFPYPEPERLVGIGAAYPRLNRGLEFFEAISGPEYEAIRAAAPALGRISAFDLGNEPVLLGAVPERVFTAYFFDDPFPALGVSPWAGRSFEEGELRARAPVALISHRLARTMHSDPAALLGTSLRLGGRPRTVVGIIPPRVVLYDTDLWIPMDSAAAVLPVNRRQFNLIGRLAAGADLDTANRELIAAAAGVAAAHGAAHKEYDGFRFEARRWTEVHAWGMSHIALICFAGVGLLLVLIVANLANLVLAATAGRAREMAVRTALGAGRRRLAAQIVTEAAILSALGGACGVVLALAGLRLLLGGLPDLIPPGVDVRLSGRVVLLAAVLSGLTALIVSLVPVLRLSRMDPASILGAAGGRTSGDRGSRRIQAAVVSFQVAVALVVASSAALLAVAIGRVLSTEPGFDNRGVMVMRLTLPLPKYDGPRAMAFFDALVERVGALPSVSSVSLSNQPPPGLFSRAQFAIEGQPEPEQLPSAFFTTAGPRYGETLGLELRHGRWFDARAGRDGVREVVINEPAAQRFFPGENPVGRQVRITPPHSDGRPMAIVGVVRAVRNRGLVPDPAPEIIGSVRQIPDRRQSQLYLVVRARQDTAPLLGDVRGVIAGLDPEQPVYAVSTIASQYETGVAARRATALLLSIFAALALALACLGVYGVMSRSVAARTREIGIRAALGARAPVLGRMIVFDALRPVCSGLLFGALTLVLGRQVLASWVYGVRPEAAPIALTASALAAVALLAAALPAWRASRIDPLRALRME
jgi:putative ABC transport system permease protein